MEPARATTPPRSSSRFGGLFASLVESRTLAGELRDELPRAEQGYFSLLTPPAPAPLMQVTRPWSPPVRPIDTAAALSPARPFSPSADGDDGEIEQLQLVARASALLPLYVFASPAPPAADGGGGAREPAMMAVHVVGSTLVIDSVESLDEAGSRAVVCRRLPESGGGGGGGGGTVADVELDGSRLRFGHSGDEGAGVGSAGASEDVKSWFREQLEDGDGGGGGGGEGGGEGEEDEDEEEEELDVDVVLQRDGRRESRSIVPIDKRSSNRMVALNRLLKFLHDTCVGDGRTYVVSRSMEAMDVSPSAPHAQAGSSSRSSRGAISVWGVGHSGAAESRTYVACMLLRVGDSLGASRSRSCLRQRVRLYQRALDVLCGGAELIAPFSPADDLRSDLTERMAGLHARVLPSLGAAADALVSSGGAVELETHALDLAVVQLLGEIVGGPQDPSRNAERRERRARIGALLFRFAWAGASQDLEAGAQLGALQSLAIGNWALRQEELEAAPAPDAMPSVAASALSAVCFLRLARTAPADWSRGAEPGTIARLCYLPADGEPFGECQRALLLEPQPGGTAAASGEEGAGIGMLALAAHQSDESLFGQSISSLFKAIRTLAAHSALPKRRGCAHLRAHLTSFLGAVYLELGAVVFASRGRETKALEKFRQGEILFATLGSSELIARCRQGAGRTLMGHAEYGGRAQDRDLHSMKEAAANFAEALRLCSSRDEKSQHSPPQLLRELKVDLADCQLAMAAHHAEHSEEQRQALLTAAVSAYQECGENRKAGGVFLSMGRTLWSKHRQVAARNGGRASGVHAKSALLYFRKASSCFGALPGDGRLSPRDSLRTLNPSLLLAAELDYVELELELSAAKGSKKALERLLALASTVPDPSPGGPIVATRPAAQSSQAAAVGRLVQVWQAVLRLTLKDAQGAREKQNLKAAYGVTLQEGAADDCASLLCKLRELLA